MVIELDLGSDEDLVRAHVLGTHVDDAAHVGRGSESVLQVGLHPGIGGFTEQQALHLDGEDHRDDEE